jgi:hypothetical protein
MVFIDEHFERKETPHSCVEFSAKLVWDKACDSFCRSVCCIHKEKIGI